MFNSRSEKQEGNNVMASSTKCIVIATLLVVCNFSVFAQEKNVKYSDRQWTIYLSQHRLSERWMLGVDGNFSWKNKLANRASHFARVSMSYYLKKNARITAGIANVGVYSSSTGQLKKMEMRPYEEIFIKHSFKKINVINRFRVEERFHKAVVDGSIQPETLINFRFRHILLIDIPLFSFSSNAPERQVKLRVGEEVLFNAGNGVVYNVFDQNRFIVGVLLKMGNSLTIGLNYLKVFGVNNAPDSYRHVDDFRLVVLHKLDYRKKK